MRLMAAFKKSVDELPSGEWSALERLLKTFEDAWQRGDRPALDSYLAASSVDRCLTLIELVHTDLECRLRAGEPIRVERYLDQYPELAQEPEAVLNLILAEYEQRCLGEPRPRVDEYIRRFPQWAGQLSSRLTVQSDKETPGPLRTSGDSDTSARSRQPELPGFEILELLGEGGMGVVYKARQLKPRRLVALKLLRGGRPLSAAEAARFNQEAEATARLQHPNIVQVYEVGEHEGQPYFVLEYVDGGNLAHQLAGKPLPAAESAALVEVLARAIHTAHQAGVIHRDLKPANILLVAAPGSQFPGDRPGLLIPHQGSAIGHQGLMVKIADFGLAKQLDVASGATEPGAIMGTPSYMAPEQAKGSSRHAQPATDIYALGAVLYELLTGRPPFLAATPLDTLLQVATTEPVPPRRLQPAVPRDLETICLQCLAKEPRRRYLTAETLAADLQRFREHRPVLARPVSLAERLLKSARRRPAVASLLAVLLFMLTGGFGGMMRLWLQAEEQRDAAERARLEAQLQRQTAQVQQQLAERRLVDLQVATGIQLMEDGDLFAALPWFVRALHEERHLPERERLHRIRVEAVLQRCPRLLKLWTHDQPVNCAVCSRDGKLAATASDDGYARLWNVGTGQPVGTPLQHRKAVWQTAFSPDSRSLVTASWDGTAQVWDATTGQPASAPLQHKKEVWSALFSPDGRRVVTASADETAQIWDAQTGRPLGPPLRHADEVVQAVFTADGHRVVTASRDHTARLWNAANGQPIGEPLRHEGAVVHVTCSPDNRLILTSSHDGTACLWDAATGRKIGAALAHRGRVVHGAFSPDSHFLVTASSEGAARLWNTAGQLMAGDLKHGGGVVFATFSADGREVVTCSQDHTARVWDAGTGHPRSPPLRHAREVWHAAFSPEGRYLLSCSHDNTARWWDLRTPSQDIPPLRHEGEVWHAAFSPDGRRVVTASQDQTARIWDLARGKQQFQSLSHEAGIVSATFSPDGRRVVTASQDQTARIWDASTGRPIGKVLEHNEVIRRAVFSPDGRSVATASGDRTARIWAADTGLPLTAPLQHAGFVMHTVFSPDGQYLLTASADRAAQLWNVGTGKRVGAALRHDQAVVHAAFSPNCKLIVTASTDHTARIWDALSGQMVAKLIHDAEVRHAEFSPDGRWLATACGDHTARLWDSASRKPCGDPLRHGAAVGRITFSPDSRLVVTASHDGTARVWDAETGQPLSPAMRHNKEVWHADFDSGGSQVVTASGDGTARVWRLKPTTLSIPDLIGFTELMNGRRLDPSAGDQLLKGKELRRMWEDLASRPID
ncbi:MAG: protein kinase [Planctomycetia bacterium]|nr:protein kinase [Planctomycetia bacterium]